MQFQDQNLNVFYSLFLRRTSARVHTLRQGLCAQALPEHAPVAAQHRAPVPVPGVQEVLHPQAPFAHACARPQPRSPLRLPGVWTHVPAQTASGHAQQVPRGRVSIFFLVA